MHRVRLVFAACLFVTAAVGAEQRGPTPCAADPANCQARNGLATVASASDARAADDLVLLDDAEIASLCWHGVYATPSGDPATPAPDAFTVRYWSDAGGRPHQLLAAFSQAEGTLVVGVPEPAGPLPADPSFETWAYTATHAPVSLLGGVCYWIEIRNDVGPGVRWLWETADLTNGSEALADAEPFGWADAVGVGHDLTFCLDAPLGGPDCTSCGLEPSGCSERSGVNARASHGDAFRTADDFEPARTGHVSGLCWWGVYTDDASQNIPPPPDNFVVTYWTDIDGRPGEQIAVFAQSEGTLSVAAPTPAGQLLSFDAWAHTASHHPVAVLGGQRYWVSIQNLLQPDEAWYWETAASIVGHPSRTEPAPIDDWATANLNNSDHVFCIDVARAAPPPPEPCPGDLDGDRDSDFDDLAILLARFGTSCP